MREVIEGSDMTEVKEKRKIMLASGLRYRIYTMAWDGLK
jgi:hypothetical protein